MNRGTFRFYDLKNQVSIDEPKLARIAEYELRIEALTRTLAICDDDLAKYVQQRQEIQLLVGEFKKSEMLRQAVENEANELRGVLRYVKYLNPLARVVI